MITLETEIEINATPQRVWDILADLPAYGQWNPLSPTMSGKLEPGAVLTMTVQRAGVEKPMTATVKVLVVEPLRKVSWVGSAPIPGLVSGEHSLVIEPLPNGSVLFKNTEVMKGLLMPLISGAYYRSFGPQFLAMNEALKKRAETA